MSPAQRTMLALLATTSCATADHATSSGLSNAGRQSSLFSSLLQWPQHSPFKFWQSSSTAPAHLAPTEDSLSNRQLLHGCHGKTKTPMCFKKLPQCPRCRYPRGRNDGHCKKPKLKKLFNCNRANTGGSPAPPPPQPGDYEFDNGDYYGVPTLPGEPVPPSAPPNPSSSGTPPPPPPAPPNPPTLNTPGQFDYFEEYTYQRYIYDSDYEYQAPPPDADSASRQGSNTGSSVFVRVERPDEFQEALEQGVEHVLLTEHLNMTSSPFAPDVEGIDALNKAIGRVQSSTASIAGNCTGTAPASFGLKEPLPPGACAVLVEEDFLDVPLGTTSLLLDSLYVAVASPAGNGSSVLLLHVDGQLMISNSVFQGAGTKGRAIDVNTNNGGDPLLYVQGFTRDLAPGVRVTEGSTAMLDGVVFRDIELLEKTRGTVIRASAIAAYPNTTLSLVGVVFENNVVEGRPARRQAVGVSPGAGGTRTYAEPRLRVWQWPDGPFKNSESRRKTTMYLRDEVAPITAAWQAAQQAREAAAESSDP